MACYRSFAAREHTAILRMLVGEGLRLAVAGVVIGMPATFVLTTAVSRFSHLLYGVPPGDPVVLLTVSVILIWAALLACYVPAPRGVSGADGLPSVRVGYITNCLTARSWAPRAAKVKLTTKPRVTRKSSRDMVCYARAIHTAVS
jgi:hypothetical protein